jgi:hypothetical protein
MFNYLLTKKHINYSKNMKKMRKASIIFLTLTVLLVSVNLCIPNPEPAKAASNLIVNGSFETDMTTNWNIWKADTSSRTYELFRSYDVPFGAGTYSAAIQATGQAEDEFNASLNNKNKFTVDSTKNYTLIVYTKATNNTDVKAFLQREDNYQLMSQIQTLNVTGEWKKFIVNFTPTSSGSAYLAFVYGDMSNGTILNIDGIQLVETQFSISTSEIKGYIGEKNKVIKTSNIIYFTENDVEIELPYFDSQTGNATTKRFHPNLINTSGISFNMEEGTYAGIGRVYVSGNQIGQFNYNVSSKIDEITPSMLRAGEDLVISGSGFIPTENNTFVVLSSFNTENKQYDQWVAPTTMDSKLKQLSIKVPAGVISGKLLISTSFIGTDSKEKINKSNSITYQVRPVITSVEWSRRGYEQVGDKIKVHGHGLANNPYVNFYDSEGNKIDTIKAAIGEINNNEVVLESYSTKKTNAFNITVVSGGIESEIANSLSYSSKPKITSLTTKYSRVIYSSSEKIPSAKVGDQIIINGIGLKLEASSIAEFQGLNRRISIPLALENGNTAGSSVKVTVPQGALNGFIALEINGQMSNYLPLEIIPSVISINPNPILPGQTVVISAYGVGNNTQLAKVYFTNSVSGEVTLIPDSITYNGEIALVSVKAPLSAANNQTSVNLQYDRWRDDGHSYVNVQPTITGASYNNDDSILSIKGYGFSTALKENIVNYKLADEARTSVSPSVRMLGVYPTEEGQEIRIKVLDNYKSGYVSVTVSANTSNEVNFGPVSITKIVRRVEYVKNLNAVSGVLYISGYNFGSNGGVRVGNHWATVHYRSNYFIIAVIDQNYLYDNPVIVAKE